MPDRSPLLQRVDFVSRLRSDRRARALIWTAVLGGVLLPAVVVAAGIWNPWNLVYLDPGFTAPCLWVLFFAGVTLLWHLYSRGRSARARGFLGLFLCLWAGFGVMDLWSRLREPSLREHVVNTDNDVEAELTSTHNTWDVWLRADRGLLSREQWVAEIGIGDSAPPDVEARFIDADEFVITADGEEVYWVRFNAGDLHVEEERCRAPQAPVGTLPGRPSCGSG